MPADPLFKDELDLDENCFEDTGAAATHVLRRWQSAFEVTPRQINGGDCEIFAACTTHVVRRPVEMVGPEVDGYGWSSQWGGHVWVYDPETGLHHDAEKPTGISDWKEFPIYRRRISGKKGPSE